MLAGVQGICCRMSSVKHCGLPVLSPALSVYWPSISQHSFQSTGSSHSNGRLMRHCSNLPRHQFDIPTLIKLSKQRTFLLDCTSVHCIWGQSQIFACFNYGDFSVKTIIQSSEYSTRAELQQQNLYFRNNWCLICKCIQDTVYKYPIHERKQFPLLNYQ